MEENIEEIIPLNQNFLNTQQDGQIVEYFHFNNEIQTINRMGPRGNVELHVAIWYEHSGLAQLISHDESRIDEIKILFSKDSNLYGTKKETPENDNIEWSLSGYDLIEKAKRFRGQIDLYKDYSNHNLTTKLLVEIIDYYINEYLVKQEHFSKDKIKDIENVFKKAIEEQDYFKYFIQAYTFTNNFHYVLNKHLALYILDYFDPPSYSVLREKYRLINCLVHIVTLLINHPDINKYRFNGITYRGLLMKQSHLKCYSIGNHILNKSFVSTSIDRPVAEIYADIEQLRRDSDHCDPGEMSVLLKYTIQQKETAINIKDLSKISGEKEILILPFSVFKVTNIENIPDTSLVEIYLEECLENQSIDSERGINDHQNVSRSYNLEGTQNNESQRNLQNQTNKRKKNVKLICLTIIIVLCIIFTSVVMVAIPYIRTSNNNKLQNEERKNSTEDRPNKNKQQLFIPQLNSDQTWKQNGTTVAGGREEGNQLNQLDQPHGVYIDDNQTIVVADTGNHRIMQWKINASNGQIIAGENGDVLQNDRFDWPTNVIIDKQNDSLIICDSDGRRVVRCSRQKPAIVEIIIPNIHCWDLIMDNDGYLYVSDVKNHEVKRWKIGESNGTTVAGGNGKGEDLNQLNTPSFIFIDEHQSVYVSDYGNHRVMKWIKNANKGILVAGNQRKGNSSRQLSGPRGIIVDQLGSVYVADGENHRVVRWLKEAEEGTIIVGGYQGDQSNQFNYPVDLTFDRENNLYVVDRYNNRVQKFEINLNVSRSINL